VARVASSCNVFAIATFSSFKICYVFGCVQKPEKESWGTGLDVMQSALAMEKTVNQCLLDLHKLAENKGDANVR